MSDDLDDRPWTEAQWERFMYKSEIRAARFEDLLETFRDDPNCDAMICREMGWETSDEPLDWPESAEDSSEEEGFLEHESAEFVSADAEDSDSDETVDLQFGRDKREIPGYALAFDWGLRVHNDLETFVSLLEEPEPDDPLLVAFSDCLVVAVKLAGGAAMHRAGDDDTLCANIVCCKRALAAANNVLQALETLREIQAAPREVVESLLTEGQAVRDAVTARIAELRSRVWWE
jgi:hypothetical protein